MPVSTTTDGTSARRIVSFKRSIAHIPRVILRTVEPAKVFACQSVENRCTRRKVSPATSLMIRSVKRIMDIHAV